MTGISKSIENRALNFILQNFFFISHLTNQLAEIQAATVKSGIENQQTSNEWKAKIDVLLKKVSDSDKKLQKVKLEMLEMKKNDSLEGTFLPCSVHFLKLIGALFPEGIREFFTYLFVRWDLFTGRTLSHRKED